MKTWRTLVPIDLERAREWAARQPEDDPVVLFVRRFPPGNPVPVMLDRPLPADAEWTLRAAGILPPDGTLETYVAHGYGWAQVTAPMSEQRLADFEERALVGELRHALSRLLDTKTRVARLMESYPSSKTAVRWVARDCSARLDAVIADLEKIINE